MAFEYDSTLSKRLDAEKREQAGLSNLGKFVDRKLTQKVLDLLKSL